jgi:hypothetical protein
VSLIDSKYIEPARGGLSGRHGAHYKLKARSFDGKLVPWMALYNTEVSHLNKICPKCFRTPFFNDEEFCVRCGAKLEF